MVSTISLALDDLYTTTWQERLPGVSDNIFNAAPFWFWLKDKGKLKSVRGGRIIEENLAYAPNSTIVWLTRGGSVAMQDYKFLQVAQFNWRYLAANILRFGVDDQQNSGSNRILDWVSEKLDNTEDSLITNLETALAGGSGAASNQIDGLQFLVPDTANVASASFNAGGIDPSVNTWWQNQAITMAGLSFAVNGIPVMRTLLHNCMNNRKMDAPDIILNDQSTYEFYEDAVLPYYRIGNNKLADAGFDSQSFKGIPMVWSPSITQRQYFLNTRFLKFIYDPGRYFEMTSWKEIPQQVEDRAAQISLACSFTTNRRRVMGVMDTINTP